MFHVFAVKLNVDRHHKNAKGLSARDIAGQQGNMDLAFILDSERHPDEHSELKERDRQSFSGMENANSASSQRWHDDSKMFQDEYEDAALAYSSGVQVGGGMSPGERFSPMAALEHETQERNSQIESSAQGQHHSQENDYKMSPSPQEQPHTQESYSQMMSPTQGLSDKDRDDTQSAATAKDQHCSEEVSADMAVLQVNVREGKGVAQSISDTQEDEASAMGQACRISEPSSVEASTSDGYAHEYAQQHEVACRKEGNTQEHAQQEAITPGRDAQLHSPQAAYTPEDNEQGCASEFAGGGSFTPEEQHMKGTHTHGSGSSRASRHSRAIAQALLTPEQDGLSGRGQLVNGQTIQHASPLPYNTETP